MSPRTPRLTAKQVIKQLKDAGFIEIGQTGSHLKFFNQETRRTAIVPIHTT
jgi:predicted RNA binding protein YcfA (HicA-like mRNA interferase family)